MNKRNSKIIRGAFFKTFFYTFFVLIFAFSSFRCNKPTMDKDVDKISLRLKWLYVASAAGDLAAKENGFFRENGLDCTVNQGGPDFDSIKLVSSGSDDFGVTGADQLILARSRGIPIKAIAVIFQESPVCFFSKKSANIIGPQNFLGRNIGVKYGTNTETEFRAMMKNLNLDLSKLKEIPVKFDLTPFFTGQVDVWPGYESNEPITVKSKGVTINTILARDYGIRMYAQTYFTTEKTIKEKPELVKRFLRAALRGWKWAVLNPEKAAKILVKYGNMLEEDRETIGIKTQKNIVITKDTQKKGVGWMTAERWALSQDILFKQGILKKRIPVSDLFTLEFLPK